MNPTSKSTLFLLLFLLSITHSLQGQIKEKMWLKGDVAIKANPLQYVYPIYNGTVEIGVARNRSVELMFGYLPERNRDSGMYGLLNAMKGGGISSHFMVRHYKQSIYHCFFLSYGVMYKQWTYTDKALHFRNNFYYQDRQAFVPGLKFLVGKQTTLFRGNAIIEKYVGVSAKVRFDYMQNRPLYWSGYPPEDRDVSEVNFVPGFILGFSIGPVFRNKKLRTE